MSAKSTSLTLTSKLDSNTKTTMKVKPD